MTDALNRLMKFLDQLLPFLESSPLWLKYWIYVLIFLNFATIAGLSVSYLISKQQRAEAGSLQYFSIDGPRDSEEIPLGDNRTWMLVGKFPVLTGDQELEHNVTVEVHKLPDREAIPQDGKARISTALGAWRFESAKFAGEGSYEIIATAFVGRNSLWREVIVKCRDKATAYRESIEKDRALRGAPKLAWAKPENISLDQIVNQLFDKQNEFEQRYIRDNDPAGALTTVNAALDLVEPVLPLFSDDFVLQDMRAYFLKDYGMIMLRNMGRIADGQRSLDEAGKMFAAVREQKPDDESAWNGLGSVALLRGDPRSALQYIDRALELRPDYPDALIDRQTAIEEIKKQEQSSAK